MQGCLALARMMLTQDMWGKTVIEMCIRDSNGIPFLVVRAISDKADGSAHMDYAEFEMAAIEHSVKLTVRMIQEL